MKRSVVGVRSMVVDRETVHWEFELILLECLACAIFLRVFS